MNQPTIFFLIAAFILPVYWVIILKTTRTEWIGRLQSHYRHEHHTLFHRNCRGTFTLYRADA